MASANGTGEICPRTAETYVPTPRRDAAKQRVRRFRRNRAKWSQQPSFDGRLLAARAQGGRARPFDLGELGVILREIMSQKALAVWQWILAAEKGFGGHTGGLRVCHRDMATLLGCGQRSTGDAVRELVALGLVEQRPWFRLLTDAEHAQRGPLDGARKHQELTPRYVTSKKGHELIARTREFTRRNQVGNKCQPGGSQRFLRKHVKGVQGRGRPARRFVEDVKRAMAPNREPLPVATVIERRLDGRVALGSELNAAAVAKRLRTEGGRPRRADTLDDAITGAWRSFEESLKS